MPSGWKRDCTRWLSSVNPYIGPFPYRMPSTLLWFISNTCIKRLVVVCAIQGYYASHKPLASVVGEIRRWAHHFFTALAGLQTGGIRHKWPGGCLLAVRTRIRHLYYPPVDPAARIVRAESITTTVTHCVNDSIDEMPLAERDSGTSSMRPRPKM